MDGPLNFLAYIFKLYSRMHNWCCHHFIELERVARKGQHYSIRLRLKIVQYMDGAACLTLQHKQKIVLLLQFL
jgi:hypothetical protein